MQTFDHLFADELHTKIEEITGIAAADWTQPRAQVRGWGCGTLRTWHVGDYCLVELLKTSGAAWIHYLFNSRQEADEWSMSMLRATRLQGPEDRNTQYRAGRNQRYRGRGWATKERI